MTAPRDLHLGFLGKTRKAPAETAAGAPVPWDLDSELAVMGKPHPRVDAAAKVTGRARYAYDVRLPGMIFARYLRSPHASAVVKKVDLAAAKAMKGVLFSEAYEGAVVRYAGQHVAGVAAESEAILEDALAAIRVEYEVRPHAISIEAARAEGAPAVKDDGPNERPGRQGRAGGAERAARAHAAADVTVEAEYRTQVQTHSALETHGLVCQWDGETLNVWASTQGVFSTRQTMARALNLSADRVIVHAEHVGGGFGAKLGGADPWDVFCARVARETGRPCRYMLTRAEEHLVAGNRPDSIQQCKFSAKKDGTLMGAEVRAWGTGGVGGGAGVMNPGIYEFQGAHSAQSDVLTNAGGARAFRAPGHPQGVFALEGMLDELAEKLRMDPLALRKQNDRNPVRLAQYDIGAAAIGWAQRGKAGAGPGPMKRGLGMASARWGHNARPGCVVSCRINRDGTVLLANGAQDIGTGTRTVIAVVGAEELGLAPTEVEVRLGHSTDGMGHPSGGSVTAPSLGPPVREAAFRAKQALLAAVATAVGGDAAKMELRGGKVTGASRELTFKQACGLLPTDSVEGTGTGREEDFRLPRFTDEVAGVQFAEVAVDTETGLVRVVKVVAVQDCGRVVDPLLATNQINGGVIQGLSYALLEHRRLDVASGNMVNANFLDYRIAGSKDMPEIVTIPFSVSQGMTSTGMSSLGEPPTVPTAGAIANAVSHAIGARIRRLPITPDVVLAALGKL